MENRIATVALALILGVATLSPVQAREICLPEQQRRDRRASLIVLRARARPRETGPFCWNGASLDSSADSAAQLRRLRA